MATLAPAQITRPGFRLTARDLGLLEFIAGHRFVLAAHAISWMGADRAVAYKRLRGLTDLGLLSYLRPFDNQPGAYSVTLAGLKLLQSGLSVPVIDLGCFRHDSALVSLQLAITPNTPGPLLTERQMRCYDREPSEDPFFLELHQLGPGGRPRRHYPDLVLVDADGRRRAVELELSQKSRARLELILVAYAGQPQSATVTYITDVPAIAQAVTSTSLMLGVGDRVAVQLTPTPVTATTPFELPLEGSR